jgi:protein-S-isoprenylcysteine O-methyltransferase Ste14
MTMLSHTMFQIITGVLATAFLHYGMDIRGKKGARHLVGRGWQLLMMVSSFLLIAAFLSLVICIRYVGAIDWMGLTLIGVGTIFIGAAKRALGEAHTFTGQCLDGPMLVTGGIYATTRNPLYFGVLLCELGSAMIAAHQAPIVLQRHYLFWLGLLSAALMYAVSFNWTMALREARYLESRFGRQYILYRRHVRFLIPSIHRMKEGRQ